MMDDMNRPFPKTVVRRIVRNRSSRNGAGVKLIVLHSTEGGNVPKSARDLEGLGSWFDNPQAQASSHIGVDQDGTSARYANDEDKAWTQAFYNPWALSIEAVGFARENWRTAAKEEQVREIARWIARWSRLHDVPIRRAIIAPNGTIVRSGVTQHFRLGNLGGGHHDISRTAFPMRRTLRLAREYARMQNKAHQAAHEED
jgi:hypothetical protein